MSFVPGVYGHSLQGTDLAHIFPLTAWCIGHKAVFPHSPCEKTEMLECDMLNSAANVCHVLHSAASV